MMTKARLVVLVLLSLGLTGCGNPAAQRLVGKWKFDFAKAAAKEAEKRMGADQDGKAAAALGMAQMMGMKMEMIIEFKSDATGNVSTTGIPFPFAGPITWKVLEGSGEKLTVEFTNAQDKQSSKVQIALVDNDHLLFSPPNSRGKSMEFERVKE
jgi:hypothetical protein